LLATGVLLGVRSSHYQWKACEIEAGNCSLLLFLRRPSISESLGADADKFVPERFLNTKNMLGRNYFPFGYGTRPYVGYRTELLMMKVYFVLLLRSYDVLIEEFDQTFRWTASLKVGKPFLFQDSSTRNLGIANIDSTARRIKEGNHSV
jgi:cytochrome P450